MPRIAAKKMDYKIKDIKTFINCKIVQGGGNVRQKDIAEKIGKSQSRVSTYLSSRNREMPGVRDLMIIFDMIEASKEEIGELLKL